MPEYKRKVFMGIIRKQGWVNPGLYMIDTMQFNMSRITAVFCYWDGKRGVLMDIGTSDNISRVLEVLDEAGIPASKLAGITLSHYHFDHGGGCAELWKRMKFINEDFRIFTTSRTKEFLQNAEGHVRGAGTTFGAFVGTMESVPDEAFEIVGEDCSLPIEFADGAKIKLVHSPGHSPDHCSPSVIRNGRVEFMFVGEACGTFYTEDCILTTPSSMPPNFRYNEYMESLSKIRAMKPEMTGFCHFGVISGRDDVEYFFGEHVSFMERLRAGIIAAFNENPSTARVLEKTASLWENRFDRSLLDVSGSDSFFKNLRLALTYGIMIDLGFREPRYEERAGL